MATVLSASVVPYVSFVVLRKTRAQAKPNPPFGSGMSYTILCLPVILLSHASNSGFADALPAVAVGSAVAVNGATSPPQAEGSGAGGDAAQEAAAVCGEVADIEHATSYQMGALNTRVRAPAPVRRQTSVERRAWDKRHRVVRRRSASRGSCQGSRAAGARSRARRHRTPAGR